MSNKKIKHAENIHDYEVVALTSGLVSKTLKKEKRYDLRGTVVLEDRILLMIAPHMDKEVE